MTEAFDIPYHYRAVDFDRLVKEYPPPKEFVETVYRWPRTDIVKLQQERFLGAVQRAWEVPFYRDRWREAGISPNDIRSLDDLQKIPMYDVNDYRKSVEAHPPFGEYQGGNLEDLRKYPVRIFTSGGTTGTARPMSYNAWDWEVYCISHARAWYINGVRPGHRVLNTMTFALHIGAFATSYAFTNWLGAMVVNTSSGLVTPTKRQIQFLKDWRVKSILSVTDYLVYMANVAVEMGLDIKRDLNVQMLHCVGDTKSVERAWGCPAYNFYSANEFGCAALECQERSGMHVNEDMYLVEIVDVDSREPVETGKRGNIVVTALYKTGTPTIRYNTQDLCRVLDDGRCGCGSSFKRLDAILGRSDTMVRLRGLNVWPEACGDVVKRDPRVTGEYFCYVERLGEPPRDEMTVMVECAEEDADKEALARDLAAALKSALEVKLNVDVVPRGALTPLTRYGQDAKVRRFEDRRGKRSQ